jgi:hypothetical protein
MTPRRYTDVRWAIVKDCSRPHTLARGNPRAHPTNQFLPREVEAFALFGPSRRRRLMRTRGEARCQLPISVRSSRR